MPTSDFRTILAEGTRAAHERIERELALEGHVPFARYISYLQAMHAVTRRVEHDIASAIAAIGLDAHERLKTPRLERDLDYFGERDVPLPAFVIPRDMPSRIGWAYVLEGATLGGRVLYKRLAPRWSLTPERGAAFIFGYGERTASMWQAFVKALDAVSLQPAEKNACVAAATHAFETIGAAYRASVSGPHLDIARHGHGLPAAGAPCGQAPARAVERANAQQGEERFPER